MGKGIYLHQDVQNQNSNIARVISVFPRSREVIPGRFLTDKFSMMCCLTFKKKKGTKTKTNNTKLIAENATNLTDEGPILVKFYNCLTITQES